MIATALNVVKFVSHVELFTECEVGSLTKLHNRDHVDKFTRRMNILRHIGLLEADEDKIRIIRPKGTLFTILYVPTEAICPSGG